MKNIERITSRDNRHLVHVRKVRDGKVRKQMFVEGRRLVEEAFRSGIDGVLCIITDESDNKLTEIAVERCKRTIRVSASIFASIADTENPQGIAIIAERPKTGPLSLNNDSIPLVVFLNEINNPSNLGAVIRTAEAAGVQGVIVSKRSSDAFSPKALRASMGSAFRIAIWENTDLDEATEWAAANNLATVAADISASKSYASHDWRPPTLLILGSEAHGLTKTQLKNVTDIVKIPMQTQVESLNLAVSTGIILFEAKRQRMRCDDN